MPPELDLNPTAASAPAAEPASPSPSASSDAAAPPAPAAPPPYWSGNVLGEPFSIQSQDEIPEYIRDALIMRRKTSDWVGSKEREYRDRLEQHNAWRRQNEPYIRFVQDRLDELNALYPDGQSLRPDLAEFIARGKNGGAAGSQQFDIDLEALDPQSRPIVEALIGRIESANEQTRRLMQHYESQQSSAVSQAQVEAVDAFLNEHRDKGLTQPVLEAVHDELGYMASLGVNATSKADYLRLMNMALGSVLRGFTASRAGEIASAAAAEARAQDEHLRKEHSRAARIAPDTSSGGGAPAPAKDTKKYQPGVGGTAAMLMERFNLRGKG